MNTMTSEWSKIFIGIHQSQNVFKYALKVKLQVRGVE